MTDLYAAEMARLNQLAQLFDVILPVKTVQPSFSTPTGSAVINQLHENAKICARSKVNAVNEN